MVPLATARFLLSEYYLNPVSRSRQDLQVWVAPSDNGLGWAVWFACPGGKAMKPTHTTTGKVLAHWACPVATVGALPLPG